MTDGRRDGQLGAQKCRAKLGDELLPCVRFLAEPAREIPVEPRNVTGPVTQLVKSGPVPAQPVARFLYRREPA